MLLGLWKLAADGLPDDRICWSQQFTAYLFTHSANILGAHHWSGMVPGTEGTCFHPPEAYSLILERATPGRPLQAVGHTPEGLFHLLCTLTY